MFFFTFWQQFLNGIHLMFRSMIPRTTRCHIITKSVSSLLSSLKNVSIKFAQVCKNFIYDFAYTPKILFCFFQFSHSTIVVIVRLFYHFMLELSFNGFCHACFVCLLLNTIQQKVHYCCITFRCLSVRQSVSPWRYGENIFYSASIQYRQLKLVVSTIVASSVML